MTGAFGYELDLTRLTDEECDEIREQIQRYRETESVVRSGSYYRLSNMEESRHFVCWEYVSRDKSRCLLNIVITDPLANASPVHVKLKGLDPEAVYSADGEFECTGSALMENGYTFMQLTGDYPALQLDILKIK